jgi:predicted porin
MKKTLLASSALVGAALIAAPAHAGTVGSKDAMSVKLSGAMWMSAAFPDEDISAGRGRGYRLALNESEVHVNASNTADNGIKYGVSIELNGGAGEGGSDEAWAFLSSDSWGRIELGDQDDVTNRMRLGAHNAHKGFGGPIGGLGAFLAMWGGFGADNRGARVDYDNFSTSDATKVSYFSPRMGGFQVGASLTPDSGSNSGTAGLTDTDNDGDREGIISLAANYTGKFGDTGVGLSATMQNGTQEDANGSAETENDVETYDLGLKLSNGGFVAGVNYINHGETGTSVANSALGADSGTTWAVSVGWQNGPMGISAWYLDHDKDNTSTSDINARSTEITRMGIGLGYTVAPGWLLRGDFEVMDHDNISTAEVGSTTDNDGRGFMVTSMFMF